ncbi:MAG: alpha/beta hydrolase, partial [Planctomycetaceae bacterium]|nr:alpha/beta hydrolase [Planctomycetaceae bacterium]
MIDPTANNGAYRAFKRFPDSKFGLKFIHFVTSLAKYSKPDKSLSVETVNIPRRDGRGTIRTLVVKPKNAVGKLPVVVHLHGGGFALGLPEQDYDKVNRYNGAAPSIFVMPDYSLSLHEPFPAGLNDCYETLLWVRDNADVIGGRSDQLFVMGESGGGGLTAAVSEMA